MKVERLRCIGHILVILVALVANGPVFAGISKTQQVFPGVEYAYVKAYLYNISDEPRRRRPDYHIMKNGTWAASKLGDGVIVPDKTVHRFNEILSTDIRLLSQGLASCFIPRHGIVYFDRDHRPVATVSICFECQGIRVYPKPRVKPLEAASPKHIKRAEKKLDQLEKLIRGIALPVFGRKAGYLRYLKSDPDYISEGSATLKDVRFFRRLLGTQPTYQRLKTKRGRRGRRFSAFSVLPWPPLTAFNNGHTWGIYDERTQVLYGVTIRDPGVRLGSNLSVGSSFKDLKNHLKDYDGPHSPARVTVQGTGGYAARFHFKFQALQRIDIYLEGMERALAVLERRDD